MRSPGATTGTKLMDNMIATTPGHAERVAAGIPLRRLGTAKEVALNVFFLCSDMAAYITGQAICLDGGNSATLAFNGEVYNDKPQAERAVTDIIYFASATAGE